MALSLGNGWLPKVDVQYPFLPFSQVLLWKRFGNPKDTLPEIAKPLNPTASTRKEASHPFGMGKSNHKEQGCLPCQNLWMETAGKMSFSCQSAQIHEFITKNLFSWTQAFRTHILAQYLQSYRDISWLYDFANITQVFCELSNNFLVCLKHCIVPGGTMMPMGWGMFYYQLLMGSSPCHF